MITVRVAVPQALQDLGQDPGGVLIESGVGLVEQQQLGIVEQRPRN